MKELPKISDAEWEVMKIIWKSPKITSTLIIEELSGSTEWKPATIKSLISRLLNKEAIGFDKNGKEYYYYPLVSEEECRREESKSFLNKVFDGSLNSMILNFVKSEKLTADDINELRNILDNTKKSEDN
ncbi:MAG: BlaI/MecI/CopY family transcriptional regulator [Clostridium sp.]